MIGRVEILAWMTASLAIVVLVAAAVIGVSAGHPVDDAAGVGLVFSIGLPVLGAVVIRQRQGGAIGWLIIGMGLSIALATLGDRWARAALVDEPGSLPGGELASWVQAWAWMPGWVLATTLLPSCSRTAAPSAVTGCSLGWTACRRGGGSGGRRRQLAPPRGSPD